jgi:hypothetical protein
MTSVCCCEQKKDCSSCSKMIGVKNTTTTTNINPAATVAELTCDTTPLSTPTSKQRECVVCREVRPLGQMIMLPCSHLQCMYCYVQMVQDVYIRVKRQDAGSIHCPMCRHSSPLPANPFEMDAMLLSNRMKIALGSSPTSEWSSYWEDGDRCCSICNEFTFSSETGVADHVLFCRQGSRFNTISCTTQGCKMSLFRITQQTRESRNENIFHVWIKAVDLHIQKCESGKIKRVLSDRLKRLAKKLDMDSTVVLSKAQARMDVQLSALEKIIGDCSSHSSLIDKLEKREDSCIAYQL